MTDAQQEQAARRLCELRGIDPDEQLGQPATDLMSVVYSPAWKLALADIKDFLLIQEACEFGKHSSNG